MWYVARNGKKLGPISELDLVAYIKNNKVKASDLVWKEGMQDWVSAKDSTNLAVYFKAVPPEIKVVRPPEIDVLDDENVKSVAEKPRGSRLATFNKFCGGCGELLHQDAVVCPKCGVSQRAAKAATITVVNGQAPNKIVAIVLALFLGTLGVHRFYVGNAGLGVIMLLCTLFSAFLLWPIIALINIVEAIVWAFMSDSDWEMQFAKGGQ